MKNKNNISESYFGDELTRYGFMSHMESYIRQLLTDPKTAKVDDYLLSHNIDNGKALSLLLKRTNPNDEESAVLVRRERIKSGDDGKDIFSITYKLPREKYKQKMRNLYINCFESNIIKGCPINEDLNYYERPLSSGPNPFATCGNAVSQCAPDTTGDRFAGYVNQNDKAYVPHMFCDEDNMIKDIEAMDKDKKYAKCGGLNKKVVNETDCAGCMQGGGENPDAGQYIAPISKPIKRTILMTEDQLEYLRNNIEEATTTFNATSAGNAMGDMTPPGVFGDKETLNHKNILKDKNLNESKKK